MMNKNQLRQQYRKLRNELRPVDIDTHSLAIANHCLKLDIWHSSTFHLFLTITRLKEVNTEYLLQVLQGRDKNVVVSSSNFSDLSMQHRLLTDQTKIVENEYGIPEPVNGLPVAVDQLEVIFVPMLVNDKTGYRLGYGKGFYDRFLAQCRPEVVKVGLSFFEPIEKLPDVAQHDIPCDVTVTPTGVFKH